MRVYLAGYIAGGDALTHCLHWRKQIRAFYDNYKGKKYPIEWLDPLNSGELEDIDNLGLKSNIPPNAIVQKDLLSIQYADILIANLDTFGRSRPPIGTLSEIAIAWYLRKPIILITNEEHYKSHPFLAYFSSVIVPDVETLLKEKHINMFFKSINSAEY